LTRSPRPISRLPLVLLLSIENTSDSSLHRRSLKDIKGISGIQAVRIIEQRVGDKAITLVASNTKEYIGQAARRNRAWKVLNGRSPIQPDELQNQPLIVLSENASHVLGLKAGDSISLPTATGVHDFKVRAVVVDYSSELGTGFIDRRFYVRCGKTKPLTPSICISTIEQTRRG